MLQVNINLFLILPKDVTAYTNAYFGEGNGPYHLTSVNCYGDEENLLSCSKYTNHHCERNEDAGVACHEGMTMYYYTNLYCTIIGVRQ